MLFWHWLFLICNIADNHVFSSTLRLGTFYPVADSIVCVCNGSYGRTCRLPPFRAVVSRDFDGDFGGQSLGIINNGSGLLIACISTSNDFYRLNKPPGSVICENRFVERPDYRFFVSTLFKRPLAK